MSESQNTKAALPAVQRTQKHNGFDMATLTLLTNASCLGKLECLDSFAALKNKQKSQLRHDIRFYRKRLLSSFKDLLLRREEKQVSAKSQAAFEAFVTTLIEDYRVTDMTDSLQDQQSQEDGNTVEETITSLEDEQLKVTEANDLLLNTRNIPITLDKFVIRKKLEQPYPWNERARNAKQVQESPLQETRVNLEDPSLRTKGVSSKSKSKNRTNQKATGQAQVTQSNPEQDCTRDMLQENIARKYDKTDADKKKKQKTKPKDE